VPQEFQPVADEIAPPTVEELQTKLAAAETKAAAEERAKKAILGEKKALEARVDGIPADFDPEKWKTLTAGEKQREEEAARKAGEFDKLLAQRTELHGKELAKQKEREAKITNALHRRLVQAELVAAITKAGGDPDLVLHHGERAVKVKETDDDFTAYVVNADGTPRVKDGAGSPFGFDDLAMELREKYPRAFAGSGSTGSGAPSHATGGGAAGTITVNRNDPGAMGRLTPQQTKDIAAGTLKVVFT
jgi:hypothetical protein